MPLQQRIITSLLVAFLSIAAFLATPVEGRPDSQDPEISHDLSMVKERTLLLLTGGATTGSYSVRNAREAEPWVTQYLQAPYQPIVRIEEDPDATTDNSVRRSNELRWLAGAYANVNSRHFQSKAILERIIDPLEDLLSMYGSSAEKGGNWHSWLISIPDDLGAIGLMLEQQLPPALMDQVIRILSGYLQDMVLTGANATWEARNHVYLALLTHDEERIRKAAERIFIDFRLTNDSGIREDYGYMFHGRIPYAGTYGAGMVRTIANFAYLFKGTPWALSAEKTILMENVLLEHFQWFMVGNWMDFVISGRSYAHTRSSTSVLETMLMMAALNYPRSDALRSGSKALLEAGAVPSVMAAPFADELMASDTAAEYPEGFRFWYSMETGAYRGKGFHIGWRQYSNRVQDYEYLTRAGAEGWNLAMGHTHLMRLDESRSWYKDGRLSPHINMEFLTGVTSREGANPVNPREHLGSSGFSLNYGTSPLSGGAGWEDGGVSGFLLIPPYGGIEARKSLHFFPEGYWALGSGIRSTEKASRRAGTVRTNLLQWRLDDDKAKLTVSGSRPSEVPLDGKRIRNAQWAYLDGVGVVFDQPTTFYCQRDGDVVTLWIDHGRNPTDAGYAYAILPLTSLAGTKAFAADKPYRPLKTGPFVHAVAHSSGDRLGAVFFEAGTVRDLRAEQPLIVYRRTDPEGQIFSIQDPLHTEGTVILTTGALPETSFRDPAISVIPTGPESSRIEVSTLLGRIYRLGTGSFGAAATPVPREDLADLHRFSVKAESTAEHTYLTLTMPPFWQEVPYRISIHGLKGHHLTYLDKDDLLEVLPDNRVRYRWVRGTVPPGEDSGHVLNQKFGDFRIWFETEMEIGIDFFVVPEFDEAGNLIPEINFDRDRNSPYRLL